MNKKKGIWMGWFGFLLLGLVWACEKAPKQMKYHAVGYVRSMWCYNVYYCTIVFEGDDKVVFSIRVTDGIPPVWVGIHAEVEYERFPEGPDFRNFIVIKRLP